MKKFFRIHLLLSTLAASFNFCSAQDSIKKAEADQEKIFTIVEEMPRFPGGTEEMFSFIRANIRYPEVAQKDNIQGKVYVNFIIDIDGTVINPKISRGIGGGCDEEAIRVVKLLPKWIAGKQNGITVKVSYTLPISFKLKMVEEDLIYTIVEVMPEFPGGEAKMMEFINKNKRDPSYKKGVSGNVWVKFVVNEFGDVINPVIIQGLEENCDEEALRLIRLLPKWKPGTQNGKPVPVYFTRAISFSSR